MTSQAKKRLITGFQWGFTIVAFWYVAHGISWAKIFDLFANIYYISILTIVGITILEFGTRFSQWWVLLDEIENTPLSTVIQIDLAIKFINHIIPSKASGHSIAPLVIKHYTNIRWSDAVTVSGVNTGFYATLYGLVSVCGVLLFFRRLPGGLAIIISLSAGVYAVVGVLVLFAGYRLELAGSLLGYTQQTAATIPRFGNQLAGVMSKLPSFTEKSAAVFRTLASQLSVVVPYALAWLGTLAVFPGIRVAILLMELGGSFSPLWLLPVALIMSYSVTVIPLTPGGVGVAEASATLMLVSLGVSQEVAVTVILVDRVFGVYFPALLGAIPIADLDLTELVSTEQ